MAFTRANLQRVGQQNDLAPTLWMYSTADTLATVDTTGYFSSTTNADGAADLLKPGDLIWIAKPVSQSTGNGPMAAHTGAFSMVLTNTRDMTASPVVYGVVNTSSVLASTTAFAVDSD